MVARAKGRFIPVSTRKMRRVARMLRGMEVPRARAVLKNLPKGACRPIGKVLDSAVANATREGTWDPQQLVVSHISANEGPMMKRYRAAPMGRSTEIRKRWTHLTIELDVVQQRAEVKGGA